MFEFTLNYFLAFVGLYLLFVLIHLFARKKEKENLEGLSGLVILLLLALIVSSGLGLSDGKSVEEYVGEKEVSREDIIKPLLKDKDLIAHSLDNDSLDYDEVKALLRAGEVLNIYGLEEKIAKFEKDADNISKAKLEFEIERIMKEL